MRIFCWVEYILSYVGDDKTVTDDKPTDDKTVTDDKTTDGDKNI